VWNVRGTHTLFAISKITILHVRFYITRTAHASVFLTSVLAWLLPYTLLYARKLQFFSNKVITTKSYIYKYKSTSWISDRVKNQLRSYLIIDLSKHWVRVWFRLGQKKWLGQDLCLEPNLIHWLVTSGQAISLVFLLWVRFLQVDRPMSQKSWPELDPTQCQVGWSMNRSTW